MGMKFVPLVCVVMLAAVVAPATAQNRRQPIDPQQLPITQPTLPQAFERIDGSQRYWQDESIAGDASFVFGAPTYRNNDIIHRARRINYLSTDAWYQQSNQPPIRTRDLDSPFCTSMYGTPFPCNLMVESPLPPPQQPLLTPTPPPPPTVMPAPPVRALY
ncbi:MAG: hypothetical protein P3X23_002390 [Thermosynechococcus sp. Uc]|uniref:hypothetical protein n=1 Tax=Thermosynechococcus sp. Uc TaxID=3034853 RepID=UPI0019FF4129|nr:hypothetical protein [Thermosynechococcus sp. Uc]MDM7325957.1 hypothetical protein [Thermosynechococcus sp. Uc]HIK24785.1 hypothetical protein [Thermosynechococcus sp. M46_R2017_013]